MALEARGSPWNLKDPSFGAWWWWRGERLFLCSECWRGGWLCVQDGEWNGRQGLGEPPRELAVLAVWEGS